jgi:hypothetical protein
MILKDTQTGAMHMLLETHETQLYKSKPKLSSVVHDKDKIPSFCAHNYFVNEPLCVVNIQ